MEWRSARPRKGQLPLAGCAWEPPCFKQGTCPDQYPRYFRSSQDAKLYWLDRKAKEWTGESPTDEMGRDHNLWLDWWLLDRLRQPDNL